MIVQFTTTEENGEINQSTIAVTEEFEHTIAEMVKQSPKADTYKSGITQIELFYDMRQALLENAKDSLAVTRIEGSYAPRFKYDVPTSEILHIVGLKDSDPEACLSAIAQCVNEHCLNSEIKNSFTVKVRGMVKLPYGNPDDAAHSEAKLAHILSLFTQLHELSENQSNGGGSANNNAPAGTQGNPNNDSGGGANDDSQRKKPRCT